MSDLIDRDGPSGRRAASFLTPRRTDATMVPSTIKERVDTLIDDLFREGSVASASLASILVAAQDSAEKGCLLELSRRVWAVTNELTPEVCGSAKAAPVAKVERRLGKHPTR
jgi:hypothetical protein